MKRTITSSLLFLLPIYRSAFVYGSPGDWFMFTIAMCASLANHSHVHHPDAGRRRLFQILDVAYMHMMGAVLVCDAYLFYGHSALTIGSAAGLVYVVYCGLGSAPMEEYPAWRRWWHVAFHHVAIATITASRCFPDDLARLVQ